MKCKYCGKEIKPYEPGTMLREDESGVFAAHEVCHVELAEPTYKTADDIIEEMEEE